MMISAYRPDDIKPFYPATLDIETGSDGSVLAIGFAYQTEDNEREYTVYSNWKDFLSYLLSLISKYRSNRAMLHRINRIWAHNGANFDWLSFVEYIRDNNLAKDTQYILSNSTGIGVVIKLRSKETIRLYDSNRLLPGSLDKLCKEFNTASVKQDVPKQYKSKMEIFLKKYPKQFYEYLKADVLSLQEVIHTFWTMIYELEGSIGFLTMTLPALALRIFRKLLPDDFVITVPWNKEVKDFTRRAYTGGRVELAKPGKHANVAVYDVNSMYPAVMASNVFPSSARCGWCAPGEYRTDMLGFYEIEYEQTTKTVTPVLRDEKSKDFTYSGQGVYTSSEIDLLQEIGANITVKSGLVFQRSTALFKTFVDKYYALKQQAIASGNSALAFVAKILMNSLYGKFGQSGVKQQIEQVKIDRIREVIENGGNCHILSEDYMVVMESDVVEHEFVAIAAFVTSYARIVLFRAILAARDKYIYSDTDSVHIISNSVDDSEYVYNVGDKLGQMKLEVRGEGIYNGKKLYSIKTDTEVKLKAKGIGRAVHNGDITHELFDKLASGEVTAYEVTFDAFPTVKEVLSRKSPACVMTTRTRTIRKLQ